MSQSESTKTDSIPIEECDGLVSTSSSCVVVEDEEGAEYSAEKNGLGNILNWMSTGASIGGIVALLGLVAVPVVGLGATSLGMLVPAIGVLALLASIMTALEEEDYGEGESLYYWWSIPFTVSSSIVYVVSLAGFAMAGLLGGLLVGVVFTVVVSVVTNRLMYKYGVADVATRSEDRDGEDVDPAFQ